MGKNFRETLNEQLRDPAFKAEWDALEPERQIMRAILEGRDEQSLTQKQLAEVTGIAQADISRFENGTGNPSLRTLKRLADGLGDASQSGVRPQKTNCIRKAAGLWNTPRLAALIVVFSSGHGGFHFPDDFQDGIQFLGGAIGQQLVKLTLVEAPHLRHIGPKQGVR